MRVKSLQGKNGQRRYYYQCHDFSDRKACRSNYSSYLRVEEQAADLFRRLVMESDLPAAVDSYIAQHDPTSALADVEARLKVLLEKKKRLEDGYLDGAIGLITFKERQTNIDEQIRYLTTTSSSLAAIQSRASRRAALLEQLSKTLSSGMPLNSAIPRSKLKLFYRELFESMNVREGDIVSHRLRV